MEQMEFRKTLGHFATGVTVITTIDKAGNPIGLTANSFSSLSLEPPLILVCIDEKSDSLPALKKGAPFIVNVLSKDQENTCWSFAKKGEDKFKDEYYGVAESNVPYFPNNLATIECTIYENFVAGDHVIVTGYVHHVDYNEKAEPLLFFRGKTTSLS